MSIQDQAVQIQINAIQKKTGKALDDLVVVDTKLIAWVKASFESAG
jgi:hypothetical protein